MDANRLDSARVVSVWMLDGVRVHDKLMKGHTQRVRVLRGEQLAVAHPASGRAGHVRMRRCIDYLQPDLTAWASSLKGAHDHTAIIPNGSACAQLGPILMPTGRGFCGTSRRRQDLRALSCTTESALVRAFRGAPPAVASAGASAQPRSFARTALTRRPAPRVGRRPDRRVSHPLRTRSGLPAIGSESVRWSFVLRDGVGVAAGVSCRVRGRRRARAATAARWPARRTRQGGWGR